MSKTKLHTRSPSGLVDGDNIEDVMLHKLDTFLYELETRLDGWESYGLEKLGSFDDSVRHAYEVLSRVRSEVIGEGWRKAEQLLRIMEEHYMDDVEASGSSEDSSEDVDEASFVATSDDGRPRTRGWHKRNAQNSGKTSEHTTESADAPPDLGSRVSAGLKQLETKLEAIEQKYGRYLDGTWSEAVQMALHAASSRLLTYDELPHEWRENPYIVRGYRFYKGYKDCAYSLVKMHNETCNIWTHLIGFFIMLALAVFHLPTTISWRDATLSDRFTMGLFLIAAMKCLVCSAVWHTFNGICHLDAKKNLACVDYTGITVLIAASMLTTEYAALYCQPLARNAYMTVTALSCLGGVLFTWDASFDRPESKLRRVAFFVGFAGTGFVGFFHAAYLHGLANAYWFHLPVFKSLGCYSLGVVVYSLLIPERWFPGSIFDYCGMSHNLWHVCVFAGIYYHYVATIGLLEGARAFSCTA